MLQSVESNSGSVRPQKDISQRFCDFTKVLYKPPIIASQPQKPRSCLMFDGCGQSATTWILDGSVDTPALDIK